MIKKYHFGGSVQKFWKNRKEMVNIKAFPYLSERYCKRSPRKFIFFSPFLMPEKLVKFQIIIKKYLKKDCTIQRQKTEQLLC